jgi:tellurite resistance protein TerC
LKTGLALVLAFVGIKMIVADYFPVPTLISLAVIVLTLAVTITVSIIVTQKRTAAENRK